MIAFQCMVFRRKKSDRPLENDGFAAKRAAMVREQLVARDIRNKAVLDAMGKVPRHRFLPRKRRDAAYDDCPVQISAGQTISQPYIVASMTEHLQLTRDSRVLEIGTGCGYQAAVLAEIAKEVFSVEIIPELHDSTRHTLKQIGYHRIRTKVADGALGWKEEAPFDGIIITAAPQEVPPALVAQLKTGGLMVLPVATGPYNRQELRKIRKTNCGVESETLYEVRFVPMVGAIED